MLSVDRESRNTLAVFLVFFLLRGFFRGQIVDNLLIWCLVTSTTTFIAALTRIYSQLKEVVDKQWEVRLYLWAFLTACIGLVLYDRNKLAPGIPVIP